MIPSALVYQWLLTSAALQSKFLGSSVFNKQTRSHYDFIIVGGGTGGCVLASRLSEIPEFNVLLLERGNSGNDFSDISFLVSDVQSEEFAEELLTVKQRHSFQNNDGIAKYTIGRSLGGGSTHNDMNFVRGSAEGYNSWARMGATGWSYNEILKYFKKLETYHPNPNIPYDASARGNNGPIHAQPLSSNPAVTQAFLNAAAERGYTIGDYNSYFTSYDNFQTSAFNGVRSSARRAYLQPALGRVNLDVVCQATVTRILFRRNRAVGVEYVRSGSTVTVWADKEVIVSASALRSPQLLMVSGVGPAGMLNQMGIPVVKDLPGVGRSLQDHPAFTVKGRVQPLYDHLLSGRDITDFDRSKIGPLTLTGTAGLLTTTNYESKDQQDTRYHIPIYITGEDSPTLLPSPLGKKYMVDVPIVDQVGHIVQSVISAKILLLVPESRGSVTIQSTDMRDDPVIDGQILSDLRDRKAAADMIRTTVRFLRDSRSLRSLNVTGVTADEQNSCSNFTADSEPYYACIAEQNTESDWHYCCTARMGRREDPLAVVDPSLKVYGVKGLRVVDASVMPSVSRGNTNIPVIMIAEKAADMIKQEYGKRRETLLLQRFDDVQLLNQSLPVAKLTISIA